KQTSRPPARRIAARITAAALALRRVVPGGAAYGTDMLSLTAKLCLQRLLSGGREEDVVQDEPIARGSGMHRKVGGGSSDVVLRVLGIVSTEVREEALAVLSMNVLHPRRSLFES